MPDLFDPNIIPGYQPPQALTPIGPIAPLGGGAGLGAALGGGAQAGAALPQQAPPIGAQATQPQVDPRENLQGWQRVKQRVQKTPGGSEALMILGAALLQPGRVEENLGKGVQQAVAFMSQARDKESALRLEERKLGQGDRQLGQTDRQLDQADTTERRLREASEGQLQFQEKQLTSVEKRHNEDYRLAKNDLDFRKSQDRERLKETLLVNGIREQEADLAVANAARAAETHRKLLPFLERQAEADIGAKEAQAASAQSLAETRRGLSPFASRAIQALMEQRILMDDDKFNSSLEAILELEKRVKAEAAGAAGTEGGEVTLSNGVKLPQADFAVMKQKLQANPSQKNKDTVDNHFGKAGTADLILSGGG